MRRIRCRMRIVLAEDHPAMRTALARLFETQSDLEIVGTATNGKEAVELARKLLPEVVFMDISMPIMDGLDATRLIAAEFPQIRVIGFSANDVGKTAMLKAGAIGYVCKDCPPAELLATIRSLLRQPGTKPTGGRRPGGTPGRR